MKRLFSTIIIGLTISACTQTKKVKAVVEPWTTVDTVKLTQELLEGNASDACEIINQKKAICSDLIKKLQEDTDFLPIDSHKDTKMKRIHDKTLATSDKAGYDTKETEYLISKKVSKELWVLEEIIFTSDYDKEKGYKIKYKAKQYGSYNEWKK